MSSNCHHDDNPIALTQRQATDVSMETGYRDSSDSSSEMSSSSDESSSASDNEGILRQAGVTLDLSTITSIDGHAPLELVSQCVSCLMSDNHEAASLLCQKVMELEPGNSTVKEMYPLLQERLRLNQQLPSESSSNDEEEEEDDERDTSSESESSRSSSSEVEDESERGTPAYESLTNSHHCTH